MGSCIFSSPFFSDEYKFSCNMQLLEALDWKLMHESDPSPAQVIIKHNELLWLIDFREYHLVNLFLLFVCYRNEFLSFRWMVIYWLPVRWDLIFTCNVRLTFVCWSSTKLPPSQIYFPLLFLASLERVPFPFWDIIGVPKSRFLIWDREYTNRGTK